MGCTTGSAVKHSRVKKLLVGLLVYVGAILILTALLTPLGFWLWNAFFQEIPVRRAFNRSLLIAALALLWPLLKYWKIQNWKQLGWSGPGGLSLKNLGVGMIFGMGVMGVLLFVALLLEERSLISPEQLQWGWRPLIYFLSVIPLGLIEETLFRGAFFLAILGLLKNRAWLWALVGSMFFATVHFLKAVNPSGDVDLAVGFRILTETAWTAWATPEALPRWLTLLVFGLLLCALAYRFNGLGIAAGFHAGIVFMMKMGQHMSVDRDTGGRSWFDADLVTGWAPLFLMGILLVGVLAGGKKKGGVKRPLW